MESVPAQEPFQRGCWVLKSGIWVDGGVHGKVEDSFRGEWHNSTIATGAMEY